MNIVLRNGKVIPFRMPGASNVVAVVNAVKELLLPLREGMDYLIVETEVLNGKSEA